MRPKRIILVRHGESEGNLDKNQYETVPDYALNLTPKGVDQARQAGAEIKNLIGTETLHVYVSPYYRTRQTYQCIKEYVGTNVVKAVEDPRLRVVVRRHEGGRHVHRDGAARHADEV